MSKRLKPCPWKLSSDHLRGEQHSTEFIKGEEGYGSPTWVVRCSCGAEGPTDYSEEGAATAWNTRSPNPLVAVLRSMKRKHSECEDSWYSCPKSENGCANDGAGDECDCGADNANEMIDKAIEEYGEK
jgi:hypothetical protein